MVLQGGEGDAISLRLEHLSLAAQECGPHQRQCSARPRGERGPDCAIFKIRLVSNFTVSPGNSGKTARENLVPSFQML